MLSPWIIHCCHHDSPHFVRYSMLRVLECAFPPKLLFCPTDVGAEMVGLLRGWDSNKMGYGLLWTRTPHWCYAVTDCLHWAGWPINRSDSDIIIVSSPAALSNYIPSWFLKDGAILISWVFMRSMKSVVTC